MRQIKEERERQNDRAERARNNAGVTGKTNGAAKRRKIKRTVADYAIIAAAAVIMALDYDLFVMQNNFAPAGLNGVAAMVEHLTGGTFSLAYMSLLINIPLCIFAYFFTDKEYAVKTFVYCFIYSAIYQFLKETAILKNFRYCTNGADTIYPVLISGVLGGIAYGAAFRRNGSTGGTDIISKYVNKKNPYLNFFWVVFALNAMVAVASYFVFTQTDPVTGAVIHDYKPVCMCVLHCFISSFMANRGLQGVKSAYKFLIITKHAEEIDREIVEKLKHSATKLIGTGVYSNTERDVIICVVGKHQIVDFENIVRKYPDTFAFVETVNETIGTFRRVKRKADESFYYVDE
ncbi:MAG: YitT family protein [Candidatus Borkfalkiaceae bacterium]|nr:YitT family protein [Clostridia bacterium]MDY6222537.1 YitT family protein [Christensenellaceae bacterium]